MEQTNGMLALTRESDEDMEPGTNASALEEAKALTRKRQKLSAWLIEQRDEAIEGLKELGHSEAPVEPVKKVGRPKGSRNRVAKAPEVKS